MTSCGRRSWRARSSGFRGIPAALWADAAEEQDRRLQVSPIVEKLTELLDGFEGILPTDEIYKALGLWCEDKVIFYREAARHGRDIRARWPSLRLDQNPAKRKGLIGRSAYAKKGKSGRACNSTEISAPSLTRGSPQRSFPSSGKAPAKPGWGGRVRPRPPTVHPKKSRKPLILLRAVRPSPLFDDFSKTFYALRVCTRDALHAPLSSPCSSRVCM